MGFMVSVIVWDYAFSFENPKPGQLCNGISHGIIEFSLQRLLLRQFFNIILSSRLCVDFHKYFVLVRGSSLYSASSSCDY